MKNTGSEGFTVWKHKIGSWVHSVSITPDRGYVAAGSDRYVYLLNLQGIEIKKDG